MNKKELIKNLITDIQDIYTITNRFENTEKIHPLDIDLALSKVRNLYELLLKLNPQDTYLTENQKEEISTPVKQLEKEDKTVIAEKPQLSTQPKPEVKEPKLEKQAQKTEQEEKEPEATTNSSTETLSNKEEAPNEQIKEDIEDETGQPSSSPEIVADKFHSKKFVHDNISKKNSKKDVSSKMQSKPINDINSAIGLNDKFIFIRELFNNDKDYYNETIQVLNNFDTYENAVEFLNENFDWDIEDSNFERLKELVRRKYAIK